MNRPLFILFLFLISSTAFAAETNIIHKKECCHFHLSNAGEKMIVGQGIPIVEEKLAFDIEDNDADLKNNLKHGSFASITLFKIGSRKLSPTSFFSQHLSLNKSEYNSILRI
jgi:hypothetical protein